MQGLNNKRVIVAGGASGIGAATAKRLAQEGARVVIGDINMAGAEETAGAIAMSGAEAHPVEFDLSKKESVSGLINKAVAQLGGLDLLANVGADVSQETLGNDSNVMDIDLDIWDRTLTVNLTGYMLTCQAAIPHMLKSGAGAIVNVSSLAAWVGEPQRPAYGTSKAGLHALARHIARRWGRNNIRANCVALGLFLTEAGKKTLTQEQLDKTAAATAMRRLGDPDEAASLITYLLSEDASYVTGQTWAVDGGAVFRG